MFKKFSKSRKMLARCSKVLLKCLPKAPGGIQTAPRCSQHVYHRRFWRSKTLHVGQRKLKMSFELFNFVPNMCTNAPKKPKMLQCSSGAPFSHNSPPCSIPILHSSTPPLTDSHMADAITGETGGSGCHNLLAGVGKTN